MDKLMEIGILAAITIAAEIIGICKRALDEFLHLSAIAGTVAARALAAFATTVACFAFAAFVAFTAFAAFAAFPAFAAPLP